MIFDRKKLQEKLNILAKAYNPRTPMQSLQFIKFDNETLTVSDNNTTIIVKFKSDIQALIPFKQLSDIVNKLTADELDMTISDKQVVIKCGRSCFTLNLGDFNEFPHFNVLNDIDGLKINCNAFINVISSINYACSRDKKRPILTGVSFKDYAVATDSYRLARFNNNLGLNCVINYNDINNLISLLKDYDSVLIRNNKNIASFEFSDAIYQTRLLDGNYPDTAKLISNDFNYNIKIDRIKLIESIERVNIFNEEYATIILDVYDGILTISSTANEVGKAKDLLECESNDNIKFACNGNYLKEAISKFKKDVIELKLISNMKPITIQEDDMIALVLPVKVE